MKQADRSYAVSCYFTEKVAKVPWYQVCLIRRLMMIDKEEQSTEKKSDLHNTAQKIVQDRFKNKNNTINKWDIFEIFLLFLFYILLFIFW